MRYDPSATAIFIPNANVFIAINFIQTVTAVLAGVAIVLVLMGERKP